MKRLISVILSLILLIALFSSFSVSVVAASTNVLKGKNITFVGDDTTRGFVKSINKIYNLSATCYAPPAGVSLSDWRRVSSEGVIHSQILAIDKNGVDYVILNGGLADMEKSASGKEGGVFIGSVNPHDYDLPKNDMDANQVKAATFAAGVERLIKCAITRCDGKRIGFLISYATPFNTNQTAPDPGKYWEVVRKACDKWGIPYLDLYSGKASDGRSYSKDILDLYNENSVNMGPGKKTLLDKGYDTIAPYVAEWMASLPTYNLKTVMATANTTTVTGKKHPTTTTTTTTTKANTPGTTTTTTTAATSLTPPTTSKKQVQIQVVGNGEVVDSSMSTTTTTEAIAAEPTAKDGVDSTVVIILAGIGALVIAIVIIIVVIAIKKKKQ